MRLLIRDNGLPAAVGFDQAAFVDVVAKDLAGNIFKDEAIARSFTVGQQQGAPLLRAIQVVDLSEGRQISFPGSFLLLKNIRLAHLLLGPVVFIALRAGQ